MTKDTELEKIMRDPQHIKRVEEAHGATPPGFPSYVDPEQYEATVRGKEQASDGGEG